MLKISFFFFTCCIWWWDQGGGIYMTNYATVTMISCTVISNSAVLHGPLVPYHFFRKSQGKSTHFIWEFELCLIFLNSISAKLNAFFLSRFFSSGLSRKFISSGSKSQVCLPSLCIIFYFKVLCVPNSRIHCVYSQLSSTFAFNWSDSK